MFKIKLSERFKKARESLGFSQNAIAKNVGLNHNTVRKIETSEVKNPNWDYVEFLIKEGINPYFLIGESNDITGQKTAEMIPKEEHERILKELESKNKELKTKYETVQEMLKLMNLGKK